jgi:hypothetical protein
MSTGLLFVTAPEADYKLINLMLLHIRDWEYESGDRFKLVTTKNAYDLESAPAATTTPSAAADVTSPPLSSSLDNAWAGAALEDVDAFCMDLMRDEENNNNNNYTHYNTSLYVVLDSTGAQARSAILGQRASDYEAQDFAWLDRFDKMRVPWEDLYSPWCNLDIANMGFEEFTREFDDGGQAGEAGCWFTYRKILGGVELSEDNRRRRDEEVRRFRDAGHI